MKTLLCILCFTAAAAALSACEFTFEITNSEGITGTITPEKTAVLTQGEMYTLSFSYWEDHRSCPLGPEGTMFLLNGERWRVQRETQPLVLTDSPYWEDTASRSKTGEVHFIAAEPGRWILEILRVCSREGYHGRLFFLISEGGSS